MLPRPRRLAVACAAMVLAGAAACGDGGGTDDARPGQARDAGREAGLPDDVQDFMALAALGLQATFQVTYDSTGPQGTGQVVVTQRPPDRRVDVVGSTGAVDSTIFVDDETYQCSRATSGEWRCVAAPASEASATGAFDPDTLDATTRALRDARDDYDFVVEEREIARVQARCLVTTLKAGRQPSADQAQAGTLCLSPEGASLWVERFGERLAASAYTTTVDAGLFELPAAVP